VVEEINVTVGPLSDCRVEAIRWETHTAPGAGRPQQVINDQVGSYDVFLGIMWRRFGTPCGVAGSGTEEEFRIAYERWQDNPDLVLMFYFCQAPFYPKALAELDQMRQVLLFRQEIEGKALAWTYDSPVNFEATIRKHLCLRLPRLVEHRKKTTVAKAEPNDDTIHMLNRLWARMSPDLQKAFSIAYNENRLAGDPGIQTRDLFAALRRVGASSLQSIVSEIPPAALPEPTSGPVSEEPYIVQERPWLSHCVASSIRRLSGTLPEGRVLTAADVFADIAKNGSGTSVALLREHKIGPSEIDAILRQKNIQVVGA
jgi:hypothetical protein